MVFIVQVLGAKSGILYATTGIVDCSKKEISMLELEIFINNGWNVDEIERRTGVSNHVIKSEAGFLLRQMGVKHYEYELLHILLTQNGAKEEKSQHKQPKLIDLSELEQKIVAKILQGVAFDNLRKDLKISSHTLKTHLRSILRDFGVKDVEFTLLVRLLNPKNDTE